jgi:dihydrofolate reductase
MWNIISLDGYFEGEKQWDLSFHDKIWGPELEKMSLEQLRSADYLVLGRVTYEGMAAYWSKADSENSAITRLMNSLPKLVVSKTLKEVSWSNSTLIRGNVSDEISRLKAKGDGDMLIFGSGNLSSTFINDDLFDEYRIGIAPVILGKGTPLFKQGVSLRNLELLSTQPLSTGGIVLRFGRKS